MKRFQKILLSGGALLGASAVLSKVLGLLRDRLFLDIFGEGSTVDLIFASFRIPDFFFALLIGGTVSTLFLPRVSSLDTDDQHKFFSSFLWGVIFLFGLFCGLGAIFTDPLVNLFAGGFSHELHLQMIPLARCLFGSVFLLSLSSVFSAFEQSHERFWSLALAPVLYTGIICGVLIVFRDRFGLMTVGIAAILGAAAHFLITAFSYFWNHNSVGFFWKKPIHAWKNFKSDFTFRVINNSSFQLNQSADIFIASFLVLGSVTAFSLGSNLGATLLSIVGLPLANAAFPKFAKVKHNHSEQKKILLEALKWIFFLVVPVAIFGSFIAEPLLRILYHLDGALLAMSKTVFIWTVLSLPFSCAIPVFSRAFLANDDTKTPMINSAIALLSATALAAVFAFLILPPDKAILGLAIGNFWASFCSASLFALSLRRTMR